MLALSACTERATTEASSTTLQVATTSTTAAPPQVTDTPTPDKQEVVRADGGVEGLEVLYIGHSFGRPFAENLDTATGLAGIDGHEQHIIFSGGENGAPQAMWEKPEQQALIKEQLNSGTVDVVVMICCSKELLETGGQSDQAVVDISRYALEQNPDTRIGLAMSWADYPDTYPSVDQHRARTDAGWLGYQVLADRLSSELQTDVFAFYHGAATYEIRSMFEQGLLTDVTSLIGPRASSVFTDKKGHAGNIAKDTGTLIWLHAIYGVEPLDVAPIDKYEVDIRQIAAAVLETSSG